MWPSDLLAAAEATAVARRTPGAPTSPVAEPSVVHRRPSMAQGEQRAACPAEVEPTVSVPVAPVSVRSTIQAAEEVEAVPREENSAA